MIKTYQKFLDSYTEFIFVEHAPKPCDMIFLPGNAWPQVGETAARLYREGLAGQILVSGRYSIVDGCFKGPALLKDRYPGVYATEAAFLSSVLMANGVPEAAILKEEQATFTYENALYSAKLLDEKGIRVKQAAIVCQAFHARRCLLYYQLVFPDTDFIVFPAVTQGISRDNWFLSQKGIDLVLGEVSRCAGQFGDIFNSLLYGGAPGLPVKKG